MTSAPPHPLTINIKKCAEVETTRTVTGTITTVDSKNQDVTLLFSVDIGMETLELALDGKPHSYPAYNDRILPDDAPEESIGYVIVIPTYEHNVATEVQISKHFWTDDDYIALEKAVLDQIFRRWNEAKEIAKDAFQNALLGTG